MSSASLSLPQNATSPASSFFHRNAAALKQGIKTGLAGIITYAIYIGWHLPQGYWAVFTALVVAQVTLGASWKPALYRTVGSTLGALAAMLLMTIFGLGTIRIGVVLFVLASLFGFLTVQHPSFSAAGFTAAIVLVLGRIEGTPYHIGWLRVMYTLLGSFVAFAIGALVWPVRAREGLRLKIAGILDASGALYHAVATAALQGVENENRIRQLDRELHKLRRGLTQQMDEARSELAFSRFDESAYARVIELGDQIRRRITAMAEDCSLYVHAQIDPVLLPSLPRLVEQNTQSFIDLADAIRKNEKPFGSTALDSAVRDLDSDVARLRAERVTAPFTLDRMLPFWALVFNLREVAQDLQALQSVLPQFS